MMNKLNIKIPVKGLTGNTCRIDKIMAREMWQTLQDNRNFLHPFMKNTITYKQFLKAIANGYGNYFYNLYIKC